ncbi:chemotaxis protein CheW [Pseudoduganella ginsengisoli]|uniref:Chemotaxis protein CheW n=1 Tax=Pseudoduganella ginsengisoli TaxID=1462440 RepID=A0A6L6Q242_9BURK|nr:chemotaxis protein CheW [Pseudoduganella ginsengisoli]MTW03381.1 chemotaxis protein CheW [Pseudoduganella ginsengisoli]
MTSQEPTATELFGSFVLGGDEFALPASSIREVVNFPDRISAIPLAPPYLEGIFTLRGSVIPVVNLGRIFQPDAPRADKSHKIAIVDFQQVLVGILFHATGEVLRVRPDQRSTLNYARGSTQGVIAGTILLEQGDRLIQVLDPHALISIENVPHVLALQTACQKQQRQHFHTLAARRRCVSFHVGSASFAFDMSGIQEIINVPEIHSSLLNSKLCLGRINFRGSPVAVVDFARLLAEQETAPAETCAAPPERRIIIVRTDDATVGFMVDSVDNIIHFAEDDVMPIPLLSKARSGMFRGCISRPEHEDVILLDHQQILSRSEILDMQKGHASLYPGESTAESTEQERLKRNASRKVYITFKLDMTYAVEIRKVREIIDVSGAISCPPGMPDYMRGMLNLRQQMVTLIDLRALYGMAPLAEASEQKILIGELDGNCYGLIVDAVDSIKTIEDSKRFAAPSLMRNKNADSALQRDAGEVIDITDSPDGVRTTLKVFDCGRLLEALQAELSPRAA